jgi:hypothetical protein
MHQFSRHTLSGYFSFLFYLIIAVFLISPYTVFAQQQQKNTDTLKTNKKRSYTIKITSEPDSALVYIDDSLHGKTPLLLEKYPKQSFSLRLTDKKNRYWFMNVGPIQNDEFTIHALINQSFGQLQFFSEPSNADIFLNDSLIGKTPAGPYKVPLGVNKIKIVKEKEYSWENNIQFYKLNSHLHIINANLHSRYSQLKMGSLPIEYEINFDGKKLSENEVKSLSKIRSGEHYISINRGLNKNVLESKFFVDPDTTYFLIEKINQFTVRPFLYSLVIPGLGQFSEGSKTKGAVLFSGFLAAGAAAFIFSKDYTDKSDLYETQRLRYFNSTSEMESLKNKEVMLAAKKDMDDAKSVKQVAIGIFAGVYLYNLLDALLFHSREDYLELLKSDSIIDFSTSLPNLKSDVSFNLKLSF